MHAFDGHVPAVVLRLDRNPFHHGTLGAVRSLGRKGVEVHAVVEAGGGPMGRSRYLHALHPGPDGGLDPEAPETLLECLVGVSERIGRPAVLVAMDDLSAIAVARIAPMLDGRFRIPHQPDGLPARVADKAELSRLCARWDVPHPETVIPASGAEAAEAAWRLGLPVVAKWSRPWLLPAGAGLRSTTLVHCAAEARRLYERTQEAGSRLLLQRFLPAGTDTDWFFHGAFGRGGHPLLAGSGRKELSWPVRTGLTAVGRWLPDPAVEEAALRLARRLGYQGILDLDFRRDENGCFRLVDFNPRPGAQFRLFTDAGGLDVVQAMYLDLTGQRVPEPSGGPGRVFVAENYALLAAVRGRQLPWRSGSVGRDAVPAPARSPEAGSGSGPIGTGGEGSGVEGSGGEGSGGERAGGERAGGPRPGGPRPGPVRVAPRAERGRVEAAWFAADDPLPFLAMLAAFLGRGAGKGARALRGVPAHGRRTARAVVRAPRQRGRDLPPSSTQAAPANPAAPAEPDELVTR
ncbi:ATP-grasp domain-containing protein [Streptomyces vinaceus]|uniref:ATP-grasp domain-containing protein n=2 Tax=Streptomyces vinaceus TaxID=1960 RepID=A0A5J6JHT2_STRVI|nr:ATP-grasp domain-containing protein [Streptomyces vinaceus]QEV47028.1 ATP-grasp domain-containing protein [Streptomyces vinaceus]